MEKERKHKQKQHTAIEMNRVYTQRADSNIDTLCVQYIYIVRDNTVE